VLLASVEEMYVSRKARTIRMSRDTKAGQRFVGATAGALFGKAHALSEEVHQAMIARGFTGDAKSLDRFSFQAADAAWLAACAVVVVLTLGGDRVLGS
jgi:cobalt/nickel transport system permease protein